ncbi:MAG: hypothetical protein ACTHW5_03835 [Microbacterium sp.]
MPSIAQTHPFVVGVGTHAKNHVYDHLTTAGRLLETREFTTSSAGNNRTIDWAGRRTGGYLPTLWVRVIGHNVWMGS